MISYLFLSIFFICKAVSDTLADHYSSSIFKYLPEKFWNKSLSWKNKWKLDSNGNLQTEFGFNKEKFIGSSTVFVFLTDAWHLFNHIGIISIILAIVSYKGYDNTYQLFVDMLLLASSLLWFNFFYKLFTFFK